MCNHTARYATRGVCHTQICNTNTHGPSALEYIATLSIRQLGHPLSPSSAPCRAAFRHPSNKTAAIKVTVKLCCAADTRLTVPVLSFTGAPLFYRAKRVVTRRRSTTTTNVKFNQLIEEPAAATRNAADKSFICHDDNQRRQPRFALRKLCTAKRDRGCPGLYNNERNAANCVVLINARKEMVLLKYPKILARYVSEQSCWAIARERSGAVRA